MWKFLTVFMALGLTACGGFNLAAPVQPDAMRCDIPKTDLGLGLTQQFGNDGFYTGVATALNQNTKPVLYLSGGSQHGAFGAGFLQGWASLHGGDLPDFAVVTGVSTGAILSMGAFTSTPEAVVNGYTIADEGEILDAFVSPKNGKLGLFDYLKAVQSGALGDLVPLRGEIKSLMAEFDIIAKIAAAARTTDRKLYIAAVDVDTGYAVAFDMTEMARKVDESTDQKAFLTNCFVEAIIASSSVPLAAKPVFIDNRMYIDGGARFGIISDQVEIAMASDKDSYGSAGAPPRNVYMIINGDQVTDPVCGKDNEDLCTDQFPTGTNTGTHKDWSLISLAFRSVTILTNQVSEFSQYKIEKEVKAKNDNFFFAKIQPEAKTHRFANGGETRTCQAWMETDKDRTSPLEFHPLYMQCLLDFGQSYAVNVKRW